MGRKTGINLSEAETLKHIHELKAYQTELEQMNKKMITANDIQIITQNKAAISEESIHPPNGEQQVFADTNMLQMVIRNLLERYKVYIQWWPSNHFSRID